MSDLIHLDFGAPPWHPSWDCELVVVLHEHDGPLQGVVRQRGCLYLYDCIHGEVGEGVGIWQYTLIHERELDALQDAGAPNVFQELVSELEHRDGKIAIADDALGIIAQASLSLGTTSPQSLGEQLQASFRGYQDQLERSAEAVRDADVGGLLAATG